MSTQTISLLEDQFIDMKFITRLTGLSDKRFYKLIQDGKFLKLIKLSRNSRWLKSEIENLVAGAYYQIQSLAVTSLPFPQHLNHIGNSAMKKYHAHHEALLHYSITNTGWMALPNSWFVREYATPSSRIATSLWWLIYAFLITTAGVLSFLTD